MSTNRRHFLKKASLVSTGLSLAPSILVAYQEQDKQAYNNRPAGAKYMGGFSAEKLETVRCAFIGVGARGSGFNMSFNICIMSSKFPVSQGQR